jgi:hypothetical protein
LKMWGELRMKRLLKTVPALFLSFTMAVVMLYTPHFSVNASAEYYQGDIITLGSYPQTEVTDSSLISILNYLDEGSGTVYYEGERYKKVYFEQYTTSDPDFQELSNPEGYSSQDENGYYINTAYWFKYEPIQWRVLDNSYGQLFVISEKILDAKAYREKAYYGEVPSGVTWSNSTVRSWLNGEFAYTAFSSNELAMIELSSVVNYDDPFNGTGGGATTADYLYLLSYNEATDGLYGFETDYEEWDSDRLAEGTDFAKCNGLYASTIDDYPWIPTYGKSMWNLRTTGDQEVDPGSGDDPFLNSYNYTVLWSGNIGGGNVYYRNYGVRPAMKINSCVVTFDANGGTGGTSTAMLCGEELAAPAVERPGHVFLGWDPEVPETVPEFDTTYTAQWVKTDVRLTKLSSGMEVNIQGWEEDKYYQIWTYQKIAADFLLDGVEDAPANQWILSQAYAPASSGSPQGDDSVSFYIDDFDSPDDNYTVAVRMIDSEGSFVREMRDSYTSEDVSEVKITKVLVDGEYSTGVEVKNLESGVPVVFNIIGNGVAGTEYYALLNDTFLTQTDDNEFELYTGGLSPGSCRVELIADNGETTDKKVIELQLYSSNDNTDYAEIEGMYTYLSGDTASALTCELVPIFSNGTFWYRVSEPGRAPIFTSGLFYNGELVEYLFQKPGIYLVSGFVNRQYEVRIGGHYDDGIIKTVTIPRDDATGTPAVSIAANVELPYVEKGTDVLFTANASSLPGPVEYSFWRYDAKGYVLVKDWSSSNTLAWTPARIGNYSISVRAKGAGAGSYEAVNSLSVEVYDNDDDIARGVSISINEDELNEFARPRAPIVIKATATSQNSEDLLYKFNISDNWMGGRTVQHYSANSQCIWTPRKEGVYTVSVLVKNSSSFGMYDAVESFEITVEDAEDPWDPGGGVS